MVMVVIFIVAGITAPRFADLLPGTGLRKGADQIFAGLRYARNEAATYGVRIRFEISGSTYRLTVERHPWKSPERFESMGAAWDSTPLPAEVEFSTLDGFTDGSYVEFRADGTASADATIGLRNTAGEERTILVTGTTGEVRFKKEKSE